MMCNKNVKRQSLRGKSKEKILNLFASISKIKMRHYPHLIATNENVENSIFYLFIFAIPLNYKMGIPLHLHLSVSEEIINKIKLKHFTTSKEYSWEKSVFFNINNSSKYAWVRNILSGKDIELLTICILWYSAYIAFRNLSKTWKALKGGAAKFDFLPERFKN